MNFYLNVIKFITETEQLVCSEECTSAGCWGLGNNQCLECENFELNGTCIHSCQSLPNVYQKSPTQCGQCHSECKSSCTGPNADQCLECTHARDGNYCVHQCHESKYAENGVCINCHENCVGCNGPRDTIDSNGCISCDKAIITDDKVEKCLKRDESCPGNLKKCF